MILQDRFRCFLIIFYFCGLSPNITRSSSKISVKLANKIPIIIFFTISVALAIYGGLLINLHRKYGNRTLEHLIANIFLMCDSVKFLCVYGQSFFLSQIMIEVLQHFQTVNMLIVHTERWHIDYSQLRKSYSWQFALVISTYALSIFVFSIENFSWRPGTRSGIIYKIWQFTSSISLIHVVFYIDLLKFQLRQLNLVIQHKKSIPINVLISNNGENWKQTIAVKKIKSYKTIYYHLWEISQKINHVFGWTVCALLLQGFTDFTYCSFWLYSSIRTHRPMIGIISKKAP